MCVRFRKEGERGRNNLIEDVNVGRMEEGLVGIAMELLYPADEATGSSSMIACLSHSDAIIKDVHIIVPARLNGTNERYLRDGIATGNMTHASCEDNNQPIWAVYVFGADACREHGV